MNEKLMNYLDGIFSPYEDSHTVKELKEELNVDLQEKLSDLIRGMTMKLHTG